MNKLTSTGRAFKLKVFCERAIADIHSMANIAHENMAAKATEQIRCDLVFAPHELQSLFERDK